MHEQRIFKELKMQILKNIKKFLELIYKQSNTVWRLEIPLLCNFLDLNETENYFLNYITTPIFWHFFVNH